VESRLRGRQALERGGGSPEGASGPRARRKSPEGASGPRARRRIAWGGVRPSSEVELTQRGARPSSEAETRPRGTAAGRLVGRCGFFGPWAFPFWAATTRSVFLGFATCLFVFYYFSKRGVSPVIRGPLWLSPTVVPEPLRRYPLGTRRGWRLLMGLSSLLVVVLFRGGTLAHPRVYPSKPCRSVGAPARFFHSVLSV
jgi:hypothetical protein